VVGAQVGARGWMRLLLRAIGVLRRPSHRLPVLGLGFPLWSDAGFALDP